ncbi:MAG: acetate--CoA ligase family protein [Planctomycetes bacterium]|nr:acetate--CoA ligase family protein [Planctomycetota bacterium]MCB9887038.1 acetate--CoA ligase family protein [Planctomycetota bacterium]
MTDATDPGAAPSGSTFQTIDRILRPRGVVVVGASEDPKKRGNQALAALLASGYTGQIHGVNPKGGEAHGVTFVRTVEEVQGEADTALLCTPASTVPAALQACAARGLSGAVVVALGFRETGTDGEQLELQIQQVVRETGIRVVGPNTSGILNPHRGLNLIGVPNVPAGRIALLTQSGNVSLQVMTEAMRRTRAGFSFVIGVGNEVDLRFDEYLTYLADEPNTAAIAMYVEGFRRGQKFLETAAEVTTKKPVILLKGGRSVRGKAAARSHTGALAGSFPVFRAGLKQSGVILVRRSDELLHVAESLASQPARGSYRGVAVLTDGGGHGTLATDALHYHQTQLTRLGAATTAALQQALGHKLPPSNPIDLAGAADADPMVFAKAVDVLMQDEQIGTVLVVGLFGGYHRRFSAELLAREVAAAQAIVEAAGRHRRAVVVHTLYAEMASEPLDVLRAGGVPVLASLEVACRCAAALFERGRQLDLRRGTPPPIGGKQWQGLDAVRQQERRVLLETEARDLVAGYGVPIVPATFCETADEAGAAARKVGGPVVIKAVAAGLVHKTDAGGVRLGVAPEDAGQAFDGVANSVRLYHQKRGATADLRGMLVAPALPKPIVELLIGYKKDPHYGGVIVVGLGGTTVEVLKDVTLRLLPITRDDARDMLAEIKGARLLRGHRGAPAVDREAVVDAIMALAACARSNPEVLELEVNPLFAYDRGAVAVDVRALL